METQDYAAYTEDEDTNSPIRVTARRLRNINPEGLIGLRFLDMRPDSSFHGETYLVKHFFRDSQKLCRTYEHWNHTETTLLTQCFQDRQVLAQSYEDFESSADSEELSLQLA